MAVVAMELDLTECSVAEHVASDAYVRFALFFITGHRYFKELFEFGFARRDRSGGEHNLFIVAGSPENQG